MLWHVNYFYSYISAFFATIPFFYYRETGRLIPGEKSPILIPPDVRYQFLGKFLSLVGLIPTKKKTTKLIPPDVRYQFWDEILGFFWDLEYWKRSQISLSNWFSVHFSTLFQKKSPTAFTLITLVSKSIGFCCSFGYCNSWRHNKYIFM